MVVGARVRKLRLDHGLRQEDLSKILNIGQATLSEYERGILNIPLKTLIAVAKYFDVDMNYITCVSKTKAPFPRK